MSAGRAQPGSLYKLAILGDGGVGKTALTIQLCLNQFVETYDPTIEDSYRKRIVLDGQPTTLEVLDTAGQEEYTALRDQWIRDGEGFLLVYSITERNAFSRIRHYYNQILRVKDGEPFGAVLVGNKCDRTEDRAVSVPEGERLAKELNIPFYETSAKLNINAEKAFLTAARLTRDTRNAEFEGTQHYNGSSDAIEPPSGPAVRPDSSPAPPPGSDTALAVDSPSTDASAGVTNTAASPTAASAAADAPSVAVNAKNDHQSKPQSNAPASSEQPQSGSQKRKRRSKKKKFCVVM